MFISSVFVYEGGELRTAEGSPCAAGKIRVILVKQFPGEGYAILSKDEDPLPPDPENGKVIGEGVIENRRLKLTHYDDTTVGCYDGTISWLQKLLHVSII